jgi:MFS family permease
MISFAAAVSILFILTPEHDWLLWFYVFLAGLGLGVIGAMFPPMVADMFPGPSLGRILGVISVFGAVGAGTGCWLAGHLHDLTGGYMWALISILITTISAIVFVWIAAPGKALKRQT